VAFFAETDDRCAGQENPLRLLLLLLLLLLLTTAIELSLGGSTDKTSKKTYT
jgi:hypothetical protein